MPSEISLSAKIEALLFNKNEPLKFEWLAKVLGQNIENIKLAIQELHNKLSDHGIVLVEANDTVSLGTHPTMSGLIEKLTKEELNKDIGKAGIEALSIVLYKFPVSRTSIDYIRGVNSQFIVRNLLTRGLIEKLPDSKDGRSYLYRPTLSLLSHLGIARIEELPNYLETREQLAQIESATNRNAEDN